MKRIFIAPFNWVALVTMPLWGGICLIGFFFFDAYRYPRQRKIFVEFLLGKRSIFGI